MTAPKSSLFDSFGVTSPAGQSRGETGDAFDSWAAHDEDGRAGLVIPDEILAGDWDE